MIEIFMWYFSFLHFDLMIRIQFSLGISKGSNKFGPATIWLKQSALHEAMLASTISTPNCSTITTPIIAWQLSLQDPDINGLGSNYTALLMQHLRGRKVSVCNFSTLSTFLHWLASMKVFTWKKAVAPTLASCLPSTKSLLQVQQLQDKILMWF